MLAFWMDCGTSKPIQQVPVIGFVPVNDLLAIEDLFGNVQTEDKLAGLGDNKPGSSTGSLEDPFTLFSPNSLLFRVCGNERVEYSLLGTWRIS